MRNCPPVDEGDLAVGFEPPRRDLLLVLPSMLMKGTLERCFRVLGVNGND
jgi:hypothetical protein